MTREECVDALEAYLETDDTGAEEQEWHKAVVAGLLLTVRLLDDISHQVAVA